MFLFLYFKKFKVLSISLMLAIPVDRIIGIFLLFIKFKVSSVKISPEGILKYGNFVFLYKNFKLGKSNAEQM